MQNGRMPRFFRKAIPSASPASASHAWGIEGFRILSLGFGGFKVSEAGFRAQNLDSSGVLYVALTQLLGRDL